MTLQTAHARVTDPASSHETATQIRSKEISELKQEILAYIRVCGPATLDVITDEIRYVHGNRWSPQNIRSRTADLRKTGLLTIIDRVPEEGKSRPVIRIGLPKDTR